MLRHIALLAGLVLVIAACHVQIEEDGTFKVFGTNPTPSPILVTPTPSVTPTLVHVTPTPIYDGNVSDWNIQGTEHIEPTATPRPTPTTAYQQGELTFSGEGNLSIERLSMPRGRYDVIYSITENDDHPYCIRYEDHFSVGCTSGAVGDVEHRRRITTTGLSRSLTVEISSEARYRLVFERVD